MLVNRGLDKRIVAYTYNGIIHSFWKKRKKLPIHATTQINLKNIMWREKSQTPEHVLYEFSYTTFKSKQT